MKGLQESLLCDILRVGLTLHKRERHHVDASLMWSNQVVIHLIVARQNRRNHRCLAVVLHCHRYTVSLNRFAMSASIANKPGPNIRIINEAKRNVYGSAT